MDEFNLLNEYPQLDKPRFVSKNKRTIDHRIVSSQEIKIFLMVIEIMVMEDLNMMADGKI